MRIAQVIGSVTLSQQHAAFRQPCLRLVTPLTLEQACALSVSRVEDGDRIPLNDELLVAWDDLGAGVGSLVALAEGPEAAQPFYPELRPIDAAIVALLDSLDWSQSAMKSWNTNGS